MYLYLGMKAALGAAAAVTGAGALVYILLNSRKRQRDPGKRDDLSISSEENVATCSEIKSRLAMEGSNGDSKECEDIHDTNSQYENFNGHLPRSGRNSDINLDHVAGSTNENNVSEIKNTSIPLETRECSTSLNNFDSVITSDLVDKSKRLDNMTSENNLQQANTVNDQIESEKDGIRKVLTTSGKSSDGIMPDSGLTSSCIAAGLNDTESNVLCPNIKDGIINKCTLKEQSANQEWVEVHKMAGLESHVMTEESCSSPLRPKFLDEAISLPAYPASEDISSVVLCAAKEENARESNFPQIISENSLEFTSTGVKDADLPQDHTTSSISDQENGFVVQKVNLITHREEHPVILAHFDKEDSPISSNLTKKEMSTLSSDVIVKDQSTLAYSLDHEKLISLKQGDPCSELLGPSVEEASLSSSLSREEQTTLSCSLNQEDDFGISSSTALGEQAALSSSLVQEEESAPSSSLVQEEESTPSSSLVQEEESAPSSSLVQEEESAPSSSLVQEEESTPSSSLVQEEESAPSSSLVQEEESAPSSSLVQEEKSAPSSSLVQEEESAPSSSLVQEEESAPSSSLVQEEESAPSSSLVQEEESAPSSSLVQEEESAPSSSLVQEEESAPSSSLVQEEESAPSSSLAQEEESAPSSSLAQEEESAPSSSLAQEEESAPSSSLAQEEESAPSSSLAQEEESAPSSSLAQEEESAPSSSLAQEEESAPSSSLAQEEKSAPSSSLAQEEESAPSSSLAQEEESAPSSSLAQEEESAPSSSLAQEEESAPSSSLAQEEESAPSSSLAQEEESAPSSSLAQEEESAPSSSLVQEEESAPSSSLAQEEESAPSSSLAQEEESAPSSSLVQEEESAPSSSLVQEEESAPSSSLAQEEESAPSSSLAQEEESAPSSSLAQEEESAPSSSLAQEEESAPSSSLAQEEESAPSSSLAQEEESAPSSSLAQEEESAPSSSLAQEEESAPSSSLAQEEESAPSSSLAQEEESAPSSSLVQEEESAPSSSLAQEEESAPSSSLAQEEESAPSSSLVQEEESAPSSSLVQEEESAPSSSLVQEGGFSAICSVPELRCTSCSSTKEEEFVSLHGLVQEDTLPSPGMTQAKSMASAGMDQAESVPLSCSAQAESVPSSCSAQAESVPSSCSAQAESVPSSGTAQAESVPSSGTAQAESVPSSGTAQAESVPSSGTAQAESVPSSGTAQAESVPSSGTAQAESVPSSGTAQAESVPSSGTAQVESVSSSCMVQEGYSLLSNLVMEESTIASGLDVEKGSASTCSLHMSEESTCPPGLVVEEASVHSSSLVKEEQCAISGNLDDLESKVLPNSLQKCKLDRTQLEKRATITRKKTENHCEKLVDMENLDSNEVLTQNRENTNAIESSKCLLKEIVTIEKCPSEHEQKICKQKVADKRQHINAATNKLENSTSTEKSSESSNLNCRGSGAAGTSTLRESSKSATKTGVSDRCPNIEEHLQNNSVDSTSSAPILEQENLGSGSSSLEPRNHIELEQHIFFNHPAYPFNNPEASYKFYEFEIPQALVGRLIGRKGAFVNRIKAITNCNVIVYPHKNKGLKICSIEGTKYSVMRAKDMIREYFPLERYSEVTLEEVHQLRPTLSRLQEDLVLKDLHLDLPAGVWVDIRVATVVSAGELWVQQPLHPSFAHMERLQVCMNNNYGDGSNTPPLPSPLADGTVCVVQITGQWMRCQVLSTAENVSQILLLDIGDTTFVETSLLRQIRLDYLMLPFQATQCFLSGVQPVRGDVWDDTATTAMKELVSNDYLSAEVVAWTAEDVPLVNLNRRERNQFVQLNERLVQLGHARGAPRQPLG
ncbi:platelet binding protein GspB isoform X2 [Procambarus clarkii]|uniref:platelet binding protein GspB isoform X2 n=1 Tax=Procambarus clarkii TaxID=6728 RepID=UPI003741EFAC